MAGNYARNRGRGNRGGRNDEIGEITSKIQSLNKLSDMSVKDFADEGGYADIVAKNSRNLKTNQLRKFFSAVRVMEQKENLTWQEGEAEFYLLKPQLAVASGRKNIPKNFNNLIMAVMRKVDVGNDDEKLENFKIFIQFFEYIVAYHKFHHG